MMSDAPGSDPLVSRALTALATYTGRWWICGGWAVDLHLDRVTRVHGDLDIMFPVEDTGHLYEAIGGQLGRLHKQTGDVTPWDGAEIVPGPETLVLDSAEGQLEFVPALIEADTWIFPRGSHRIRRLVDLISMSSGDVPYLAPEVVLLYKSRQLTPKDEADFVALAPRLSDEQSAWLSAGLPTDHPWLEK